MAAEFRRSLAGQQEKGRGFGVSERVSERPSGGSRRPLREDSRSLFQSAISLLELQVLLP